MNFRSQIAYLPAVLVLGLGLFSFANPLLAIRFVGLDVVDPRGLSEVRAAYGMLYLAMGAMMLWALVRRPRNNSWLRFTGFLWSAMALGRLVSIFFDGVITPVNFGMFALEVFIAVPTLSAGFQNPPSQRGGEADLAR
jgi:hypothetical protein